MTTPGTPRMTADEPVVWGKIPQKNKNFTGRTDILEQLRKDSSSKVTAVLPGAPLPQALQGLGGVGKTAVAIEYAHRYRADYDLVWWIPSDQVTLIRSSLAALAVRLGLEAATASGIEAAATAVLDALRRGEPYRRWLLIFDNADQPEDLSGYIPQGPGDVLITSRNHRWQSVFETVQVDVFARDESKEFLARRAPSRGISEFDANRLADKLGDLPLALDQAGAMLAETGMPVDEYLRLLDEHVSQIMAEGKSAEYPMSMTAAWRLSVTTLQQQLPQAQSLLRLFAFFGPDPIPRDVLGTAAPVDEATIKELIKEPILLARAIRELGRFALVKIDGRALSVHRLIQALLRDDLDTEQQGSFRHQVHLILAAGAPGSPDDTQLWPRYEELLAHVAAEATDVASCPASEVRDFALAVLRYLYLRGDLASCQDFTDRFIERWTSDSGPLDHHVLAAQHQRSSVLRQLGRYSEARQLVETTLGSVDKEMGQRYPLTLTLRNSWGADLRSAGRFAEAQAFDEETRILHEQVFGETDLRTLRMMNNLALDYGLNSDYRRARELHKEVYILQRASSGASYADVLSSWNGLARAVRLMGAYIDAQDVGEDALEYGREMLGPEHYATLRTMKDLAIALRRGDADRRADALEMASDNYEQCIRLLGSGNPDTLAAAMNVCNIQRTTDQASEALPLARQTVDSYPDVYGPSHPYNYGCASNYALLLRVTGDPAQARATNEACLDGLDATLGRNHHYSLTVATNLASDLAVLDDAPGARALGTGTLRRLRKLLGEDHPLTLGCAANLVLDLEATGAGEEAAALRLDTMARYGRTLGPDHPDTVVAASGGRIDFDFDPPPI